METLKILETYDVNTVLNAARERYATSPQSSTVPCDYAPGYANEEAQIMWFPLVHRTEQGYAAQIETTDGLFIWIGQFNTLAEAAFTAHEKAVDMVKGGYDGEDDDGEDDDGEDDDGEDE